jgi:hypothetical protein
VLSGVREVAAVILAENVFEVVADELAFELINANNDIETETYIFCLKPFEGLVQIAEKILTLHALAEMAIVFCFV